MDVCSSFLLFVVTTMALLNDESKATISEPKARKGEAGYKRTDALSQSDDIPQEQGKIRNPGTEFNRKA